MKIKNNTRIIFLLFSLCLLAFLSFNENKSDDSIFNNLFFDFIDSKDGLSNSSISSIVQDSYGFIWFSTQDGLNRYDGSGFLIFKKEPFKKNTLPAQLIQTMFMDKDDILWIGTYNGLSRFDIKKGVFTSFLCNPQDQYSLSNDVVVAIERDKDNNLWVGTLKGLQIFDEKNQRFNHILFEDKNQGPTKDTTIRDIYTDSRGDVWIGTYDGIYRYSKGNFSFFNSKKKIQNIQNSNTSIIQPNIQEYPAADPAMVIVEDKKGNIWFGVWGFGLCKYDVVKNIFENYSLPYNKIYSLLFIDNENLLIGTWGEGLYSFNISKKNFQKAKNKKLDLSIPNNTIYSLFKDESGIVWIGTHGSGVVKWVVNKPDLIYLKSNKDDNNSFADSKIKSIFEDKQGFIWIGTYNNGLYRYNPENKEIKKYISDDKYKGSISNNIIRDIFQDSNGNLWIATNKYLNLYDYKTEKFIYFQKSDFGLQEFQEDTFTAINEDKDRNLLLGTYLSGLIIVPLSSEKGKFLNIEKSKIINTKSEPSLSDDLIYKIFIDRKDNIWVGTNRGLNLIDSKFNEVKKFLYNIDNLEGLSDNTITDIYEDFYGRIWIGTSNGLNVYDYKDEKFKYFTIEKGLPDNYINSISSTDEDNIYFTTFRNLVRMNLKTFDIVSFDYDDGLLNKEFSSGRCKLKDGSLLFGGTGTINIIKSKDIYLNQFKPDIQIVSVKVEDKEINENALYYDFNSLELPYNKNSISISFVSLDYSANKSLLYSYKIDSIDKDWQPLGTNSTINLVNLKPGKYKIFLRGSNSDGIYSDKIKILNLIIKPPFYLTWWAIMIYAIIIFIIFGLVLLLIREKEFSEILLERKNIIEEKKAILEDEIKKQKEIEHNLSKSKETLENINIAKDKFLAQLSHEFRNPLSIILGSIEILKKNETDDFKLKLIKSMDYISRHILDMITAIMDNAKINLGKQELKIININLFEFCQGLADLYKVLSEQKNLNFEFNYDYNLPIEIKIDEVKVKQILNNLLSNALKYTDKGFIKFNVKLNDEINSIVFEVIDSGIGLTEVEKEKIFEDFFRTKDVAKVEGLGLGLSISKKLAQIIDSEIKVESQKGVGSKFSFELKKY